MYILSRQRARTQQKKRERESEIEYRKIWTTTPNEHAMESNIFRRRKKRKRMRGRQGKPKYQREKNKWQMYACTTKMNQLHVICVHECGSKIMMYNFNIRTNIAQQEKENWRKKKTLNIECAREKKTNTSIDRQAEREREKKKISFHLMKTHMIYKSSTHCYFRLHRSF